MPNDVGVVYVAWGKGIEEAKISAISCKKYGLRTCLITNQPIQNNYFDDVVVADFDDQHKKETPYSRKMHAYQYSPYLRTLYLDSDCHLMFDPNQWFECLDKYDMAVAHAPYPYFQWDRQHIIHFNTGVQFFSKNDRLKSLFQSWLELSELFDIEFQKDQYAFSLAVHKSLELKLLTLPYTCNYRAGLHCDCLQGPLYVWHSRLPIPNKLKNYNEQFNQQKVSFKWTYLKDLNT